MGKISGTNMPNPKSTKSPTVKNMPKKSGSLGKITNMSSKATPKPSYSAPSLAEYRKSAAYKTNSMTYKEYLKISKQVWDARNGR